MVSSSLIFFVFMISFGSATKHLKCDVSGISHLNQFFIFYFFARHLLYCLKNLSVFNKILETRTDVERKPNLF